MQKKEIIQSASGFILGVILGVILGAMIGNMLMPKKKEVVYQDRTVTKMDTITKYISKPVIKYMVKADTIKYTDTIRILTSPFVAIKDTIADKDTLNIKYYFPAGVFAVDLRRFPLQEKVINHYITITKEKRIEEEWWKKPAYLLGGLLVGFGLGRI